MDTRIVTIIFLKWMPLEIAGKGKTMLDSIQKAGVMHAFQ